MLPSQIRTKEDKGDEMRKTRMLLVAALAAVPFGLLTASPAAACKQQPCPGRCHLNSPVYVEGDQITLSDRPLVECYY